MHSDTSDASRGEYASGSTATEARRREGYGARRRAGRCGDGRTSPKPERATPVLAAARRGNARVDSPVDEMLDARSVAIFRFIVTKRGCTESIDPLRWPPTRCRGARDRVAPICAAFPTPVFAPPRPPRVQESRSAPRRLPTFPAHEPCNSEADAPCCCSPHSSRAKATALFGSHRRETLGCIRSERAAPWPGSCWPTRLGR